MAHGATKRTRSSAQTAGTIAPTSSTQVDIGGKTRSLRYSNRAVVALEEQTGITLGELSEKISAGSLKFTACVIWAGLLHEEPKITVDEVIDMIELGRLEEYSDAILNGLTAAFGKQAAGKA